jgi:hypothetical protein
MGLTIWELRQQIEQQVTVLDVAAVLVGLLIVLFVVSLKQQKK